MERGRGGNESAYSPPRRPLPAAPAPHSPFFCRLHNAHRRHTPSDHRPSRLFPRAHTHTHNTHTYKHQSPVKDLFAQVRGRLSRSPFFPPPYMHAPLGARAHHQARMARP